ncbi:hypothetical protein G6O67_007219 [Ophiocordyceps sinensis]|uniref:LysM domain-containing protein n=2 Tax=Ophiocordyceps sinensis TaxID=72228 RepID=A0A8H4PIL9_9HYPO|nr:LysM domain-containing protein [Ophiocordyceps sinensis CO18]KAF4505252.1 hypothetical protein G6O67_007219 [Ophiocordyceps sinensis]
MVYLGRLALLLGAAEFAFAGVASTGSVEARDNTWPRQPGYHRKCRSFAWVNKGDTCWGVASQNYVSLEDFMAWNSGAGKDCATLWAGTYACVQV